MTDEIFVQAIREFRHRNKCSYEFWAMDNVERFLLALIISMIIGGVIR